MNNCRDCKHFEKAPDDHQPDTVGGWGNCNLSMENSFKYGEEMLDTFKTATEQGDGNFHSCTIGMKFCPMSVTPGTPMFGSLAVHEDFGCVCHEVKA